MINFQPKEKGKKEATAQHAVVNHMIQLVIGKRNTISKREPNMSLLQWMFVTVSEEKDWTKELVFVIHKMSIPSIKKGTFLRP